MAAPRALLDSNVIIAMIALEHEHHTASIALAPDRSTKYFAVAAHSYAEAYTTLTRRSASGTFRWTAEDTIRTLEWIAAATILVGLTPVQSFDTVRSYAASGGIGPRVYDRLIGEVAVQLGIRRIITWNAGHMRDLFPRLEIVTPADAIA